jgi:hypothetical protein
MSFTNEYIYNKFCQGWYIIIIISKNTFSIKALLKIVPCRVSTGILHVLTIWCLASDEQLSHYWNLHSMGVVSLRCVFVFYWHVYVLGGAYFVWPLKSRVPHRDIVTSQQGHWPLLIRVSSITWRGSKFLEASRNVNIGTRYVCSCVGAVSGMGGGRRKTHVLLLCVSVIFFNVWHV